MSEQNEETSATVPDARDGDTPQNGAEGQGLSHRPGFRDRVYGIRSVAAVAVAGLIIGGGAGAAIHAATDDGGRDGRMGFNRGPGFGGPGGRQGGMPGGGMPGGGMPGGQMPGGGMPGGGMPGSGMPNGQPPNGFPQPPDGVPGQTQPTTPPSDDASPDSGPDTNSSNS